MHCAGICVLIVRSSGESRPTEFGALRFKINGVIFAWSETICKSPLLGRTRAGPVCVVVQIALEPVGNLPFRKTLPRVYNGTQFVVLVSVANMNFVPVLFH